MRRWRPRVTTVTLLIASFASGSPSLSGEPGDTTSLAFDFNRGPQGFVGAFADYPPADASIYELLSDHRTLPPPLESHSGLFLSGVNRSADLFMFLTGPLSGLRPGALYAVTVTAEIATDTPAGCFGVGGAPGESVWIKAGVTAVEPLPVREGSYLRMNIDIGRQSGSGEHAVVLGNIANSRSCEQPRQWELKTYEGRSMPEPVAIPGDGRVWLLIGADSGFEARTEIYFTRVSVSFAPIGSGERGSCAERYVTARAIRSREEIPAFVRCAAEYALEHGETEARRAFNEDVRWKHGQTYVFVHGLGPPAKGSVTHVFPPEPSREGTVQGMSIDGFGTSYLFELHRVLSLVDEGWIYHELASPATGRRQPMSSYVREVDWNGARAAIGATHYSPDLPGTCRVEEVNALALEEAPSEEKLREFVRCAALEVESLGYFAGPVLTGDPRWRHGSVYVFAVNAETEAVEFSGDESMFAFSGRIPELFDGRDLVRAAAHFGENFWYYRFTDPETGVVRPKTVFVKLVRAQGVPLLIGSGYDLGAVASPR